MKHEAQALDYLTATGFRLAILLNFGADSLQHERMVKRSCHGFHELTRKQKGIDGNSCNSWQKNLPWPDVNLEVASGSHAQQTAQVMLRFEPVLLEYKPDWIIVPGDVNSTAACARVANKLGVKGQ